MSLPQSSRPGRPGARAGRWAALLLLIPVIELAVAIAVGRRIGAGWTVLAIVLVSVAGLAVLRRETASALRRLSRWQPPGAPWAGDSTAGHATAAQTAGGRTAADSALILLAGLLLLVPGLVTGLVGLILLLPPVRRLVRVRAGTAIARRLGVGRIVAGEVVDGQDVDVQVIDVRDADEPPTGSAPELGPGR